MLEIKKIIRNIWKKLLFNEWNNESFVKQFFEGIGSGLKTDEIFTCQQKLEKYRETIS